MMNHDVDVSVNATVIEPAVTSENASSLNRDGASSASGRSLESKEWKIVL